MVRCTRIQYTCSTDDIAGYFDSLKTSFAEPIQIVNATAVLRQIKKQNLCQHAAKVESLLESHLNIACNKPYATQSETKMKPRGIGLIWAVPESLNFEIQMHVKSSDQNVKEQTQNAFQSGVPLSPEILKNQTWFRWQPLFTLNELHITQLFRNMEVRADSQMKNYDFCYYRCNHELQAVASTPLIGCNKCCRSFCIQCLHKYNNIQIQSITPGQIQRTEKWNCPGHAINIDD